MTLWPFTFRLTSAAIAERWAQADWVLLYRRDDGSVILDLDFALNLALLAPLGGTWALGRRGAGILGTALEGLALGVGLSSLLEAMQLLTPNRFTQLADVWRNGLGCALAAGAVAAARSWRGRARSR